MSVGRAASEEAFPRMEHFLILKIDGDPCVVGPGIATYHSVRHGRRRSTDSTY